MVLGGAVGEKYVMFGGVVDKYMKLGGAVGDKYVVLGGAGWRRKCDVE